MARMVRNDTNKYITKGSKQAEQFRITISAETSNLEKPTINEIVKKLDRCREKP